jgi:hypothetical protein
MFSHLGPLEIECDSPSYAVVEASRRIGLRDPEDVRWCRLSHFLSEPTSWRELLSLQGLKQLLGLADRKKHKTCLCGQPLPCLARYAFTYNSGAEESYLLGQCGRCRTIFWEKTGPT